MSFVGPFRAQDDGASAEREALRAHPPASYLDAGMTIRSWLTTHDHKRIAILYAFAITAFFFIGGAAATLMRIELATPAGDVVSANAYNKLFTMHGVIMVWFFLIPSIPSTLGNFLVPLMIGARDLAFPRLNLTSWYLYILGGAVTLVSLLVGCVDTGWTFYAPFPLLFQHLFWFYSHPAVYIMVLPAMGVVSEIVACFARNPIFGYRTMAYAIVAIAVIGFLVWGHHMFVSGQSVYAGIVFSMLSFIVAIPSAVKVFNWTATLWHGRISYEAPMLYALGFIGLF